MATAHRERMLKYGQWIASLAQWSQFVTLTHRPLAPHAVSRGWTSIGVNFHRRLVRDWFYGDGEFRGQGVRDIDPAARLWSETERHQSGVPHEHGLLRTSVDAIDRQMMRDIWQKVCGDYVHRQGARFDTIHDYGVNAAAYVAKYTVKSANFQPRIFGFGFTHERMSDSIMEIAVERWNAGTL